MSSQQRQPQKQQPPPIRRAEWDILLSAAQKNDVARIRFLVEQHGISPSHANGVGQSALHVAALWGHVEACQALLELGANVQATNQLSHATPLHMVVQPPHKAPLSQQADVVNLLLQYGADKTAVDAFGKLPLDYVLALDDVDDPQLVNDKNALVTTLQLSTPPLWTWIEQGQFHHLQEEWNRNNHNDNENTTDTEQLPFQRSCHDVIRKQTAVSFALQVLLEQCQAALNRSRTDDHQNDTTQADIQNEQQQPTLSHRFQIFQFLVSHGGVLRRPKETDGDDDDSSSAVVDADMAAPSVALLLGQPLPNQQFHNPLQQLEDWKEPPLFGILECLRQAYSLQQEQQQQPPQDLNEVITVLEDTTQLLQTLEDQQQQHSKSNSPTNSVDSSTNNNNNNDETKARWLHLAARRGDVRLLQLLCTKLQWNVVTLVNRQGMTALQFAARSGKVQAVQYILSQLISSGSDNDNDNDNPKYNPNHVYHTDHRGQTALDAAQANQHVAVQEVLQQFMLEHPPSSSSE